MAVREGLDVGLAKAVDAYITERADDLVALVRGLVGFNMVSVDLSPGSEHPENEELELQRFVGDRLAALGAEVDQFEPDAAALRDHPMMPPWHHWKRRPITVGTLRGEGGGRSPIINGHIDVVSPGDLERWTTPPYAADVRHGRVRPRSGRHEGRDRGGDLRPGGAGAPRRSTPCSGARASSRPSSTGARASRTSRRAARSTSMRPTSPSTPTRTGTEASPARRSCARSRTRPRTTTG